MAIENVELDAMTGGARVAVDTFTVGVDTVAAQIVKIGVSVDGDVPVQVSTTNPLPVSDAGGALTVDGTVTANAGTNLNTSALALETGGNLATIAGKDFATQTTLAALNGKVTACNTGGVVVTSGAITETNSGAIKTAVELIDNAISGAGFNITQQGGVAVSLNTGVRDSGTQRVTIATNDVVPVSITAGQTLATVTTVGTVTTCNLAAETTKVIGTVRVASGGVASGSFASGSIASGAVASGAVASGAIATGAIVDALADDATFTIATSRVFPTGLLADEVSPDSVNEGDVGIPRMTLDRMAIVTSRPSATGEGYDVHRNIDVDESEDDIKTSAGKLYGWFMHNAHTATLFVKFYNATAASTTVGTTTPFLTMPMPAGASANVEFTNGIAFSTALCIAATTGVADADTGAPAANVLIANIFYK